MKLKFKIFITIIIVLTVLFLTINLNIDAVAKHITISQKITKINNLDIKRNKIFEIFKEDLLTSYNKKYFAENRNVLLSVRQIAFHSKDPILFYAIAKRETQLISDKISSAGAITIFQIHPINTEMLKKKGIIYEFEDLKTDKIAAIRASEAIFYGMEKQYKTTDLDLLLYAYSGYMKKKHRGKSYVNDVMKTYAELQYKLQLN